MVEVTLRHFSNTRTADTTAEIQAMYDDGWRLAGISPLRIAPAKDPKFTFVEESDWDMVVVTGWYIFERERPNKDEA